MELTREYLLDCIEKHNISAVNALLGLYARQTADEQQSECTAHQNGMGFNGTDAGILSSFAEQVVNKRARGWKHGTELSDKQLALLRKKLPKYGRQLLQIAEEKQARKAANLPPTGEGAPQPVLPAQEAPFIDNGPLSHLPSGYVATENGWRMKTSREFHAEGVRLDIPMGSMIRSAGNPEPISEFEQILAACN